MSPAKANVPFPRSGDGVSGGRVAKASEVEERITSEKVEEESVPDQLARIDARQKRMEKLLEQLAEKGQRGSEMFQDN